MSKLEMVKDGENALPLGLSGLPAEILIMIVRYLHPVDLNSLMQTCQSAYDFLSPVLHREAVTYICNDWHSSPAPRWAIYNGRPALFRKLLEVDPPSFRPDVLANCLRCAVEVGDCDLVKLIVERYPDLITPRTALNLYNDAAMRNHLSIVKFLFDWGARINLKAVQDLSKGEEVLPLVHAVLSTSIEMAQYILKAGDRPSRSDRHGWSALHHAVSIGDLAMTELLLGSRAYPKAHFQRDLPIFVLTQSPRRLHAHFPPKSFDDKHKEDVLKALLRYIVDLNGCRSPRLLCPILHHFFNNQKYSWARILINAGADVSVTDLEGFTVLHHAARSGAREEFEYFMHTGIDISTLSQANNSILHCAAMGGNVEIIKLCIKVGLDPLSLNYIQKTPCDLAMYHGHKEAYLQLREITPAESGCNDQIIERNDPLAVKTILDAREGLQWIDNVDDKFLARAICDSNTPLVELLLNYRGNPNRRLNIPVQQTPLRYATDNQCDLSTIQTILRAGATVSEESLRSALQNSEPKALALAQTLLDAGAYVSSSILSVAIGSPKLNADTIRLLAHAAEIPEDALNLVCGNCGHRDEETIDALLDSGCNPSYVDHIGRTPLSYAAERSRPIAVMKKLLDAGADFSTVDNLGMSPLHYAVQDGLEDAAQCLIDAGSDMFQRDQDGQTPLSLAVQDAPHMVKLLLDAERAKASSSATEERGADEPAWKSMLVSIADNDGNTPLHRAAFGTHTMRHSRKVVDLLLAAGADTEAVNGRGRTPLDLAKAYDRERAADAIYIHRQEQRVR